MKSNLFTSLILLLAFVSLKSFALSHHLEHFELESQALECHLCGHTDTKNDSGAPSYNQFIDNSFIEYSMLVEPQITAKTQRHSASIPRAPPYTVLSTS